MEDSARVRQTTEPAACGMPRDLKKYHSMAGPAFYTSPLTAGQAARLCQLLKSSGFAVEPRDHMLCFGKREKLTVAVYHKGPKVVVQGKGLDDFVRFTLEPEILGEARFGYEEIHHPEWFEPHFGIDESGKGDFFGPLVIAGVHLNGEKTKILRGAGVTDSKRITSDARIRELAGAIRKSGTRSEVILIPPPRYNELIAKMGNVNRLLAWGHARTIENLCEAEPLCTRAVSDQFANPAVLRRALQEKGRKIELIQRTKAESDPAVAAASILAREAFIDWLERGSREAGVVLPRGASKAVILAGQEIADRSGKAALGRFAKLHFRTMESIH